MRRYGQSGRTKPLLILRYSRHSRNIERGYPNTVAASVGHSDQSAWGNVSAHTKNAIQPTDHTARKTYPMRATACRKSTIPNVSPRNRTRSKLIVIVRQPEHARPDAIFGHSVRDSSHFGGSRLPMLRIVEVVGRHSQPVAVPAPCGKLYHLAQDPREI